MNLTTQIRAMESEVDLKRSLVTLMSLALLAWGAIETVSTFEVFSNCRV